MQIIIDIKAYITFKVEMTNEPVNSLFYLQFIQQNLSAIISNDLNMTFKSHINFLIFIHSILYALTKESIRESFGFA